MSTNHTPGRLRFDACHREGFTIWGGTNEAPVCVVDAQDEEGRFGAILSEEDARRLVACWNACEGLSTEALERLATLDRARVELDVLRVQAIKQRDELQAEVARLRTALEDIAKHADPYGLRARKALAPQEGKNA